MKKINLLKIVASLTLLSVLSFVPSVDVDVSGIIENPIDFNNTTNQLNVRNKLIGSSSTVSYSQTFTQVGTNTDTGNLVLRFATAVSGSIEKLTYTRVAEGFSTVEKDVTTVYKGIIADDKVAYYNGNDIVYEENDATDNYYWACYSIEFESDTYKDLNISMSLEIIDENEEVYNPTSKTTSLNAEYVEPVLLERLEVTGDDTINHLQSIDHNREFVVKGIYSDGEERILDSSEYDVISPVDEYAIFGKEVKYTFTSKENTSISTTKLLTVNQHIEGEDSTCVGGKLTTETEYILVDGEYVEQEPVTFYGRLANSVSAGKEASLTFDIDVKTATVGGFNMRLANSNLKTNEDGLFYMADLQLNTIADFYLNDTLLEIGDDVIIPGTPLSESYTPCYGVYNNLEIDGVTFKEGINKLKIRFKESTIGELTHWNESPSETNIDYIDFYTKGINVDFESNVSSIEIDPYNSFSAPYGTLIADAMNYPIRTIATLDNGSKISLDSSEVKITSITTDEVYTLENAEDYVLFGTYTVEVALIKDENIKTSFTFTNEANKNFKVTYASLQLEGSTLYYVLQGEGPGCVLNEATIEIFDGSTIYAHTGEFTINNFTLKIDITNYALSLTNDTNLLIVPHARVDGVLYYAHKNGDIINVNFDSTTICLNNKAYYISSYYNMPALYGENFTFADRHLTVKDASLVKENDVVYYQLSGYFHGVFSKDEIKLFDGSNVLDFDLSVDVATGKYVVRVNCTTLSAMTFYPHLSVNGVAYPTNSSGDIKTYGLVINAATIDNYKLYNGWDMPVLQVS